MGRVYRGTSRDDSGDVAIKILRSELAEDVSFVGRFLQERTIMTQLRGPGIVRTIDLVAEKGRLAIVMELVSGGSLRGLLQSSSQGISESTAMQLTCDVLEGLNVAHLQGVIHRDIKPENILLQHGSVPFGAKLTDFGVSGLASSSLVTRLTGFVGTPAYMAPELADPSPATSAVDIYAMGATLFEMIAGNPPFGWENPMAVLRSHLLDNPTKPESMSEEVWEIVEATLAKEPLNRPTTSVLLSQLQRILGASTQASDGRPVVQVQHETPESATVVRPKLPSPTVAKPDLNDSSESAVEVEAQTLLSSRRQEPSTPPIQTVRGNGDSTGDELVEQTIVSRRSAFNEQEGSQRAPLSAKSRTVTIAGPTRRVDESKGGFSRGVTLFQYLIPIGVAGLNFGLLCWAGFIFRASIPAKIVVCLPASLLIALVIAVVATRWVPRSQRVIVVLLTVAVGVVATYPVNHWLGNNLPYQWNRGGEAVYALVSGVCGFFLARLASRSRLQNSKS
jgi:serine/threonine protein kinase